MTMFIKPVNKTLIVEREPIPEKKNDFGIIVPDSGRVAPRNSVVKLIGSEDNSYYEKYVSQNLLVHTNMLEDFEVRGVKGTLLPENGVIAVIAESDIL